MASSYRSDGSGVAEKDCSMQRIKVVESVTIETYI
jgi:hypothetical protein